MAKIYGLFGSMTGKVADVVMSVRNGEQIARKYQPIVANPSTTAQVEARAKLKLMSQLSAVMAPVIAMKREGSVSSRNLFVKTNYQVASYDAGHADISMVNVKLTRSVVNLPEVVATRGTNGITARLASGSNGISRVVYCVFGKVEEEVRYIGSTVQDIPGDNQLFQAEVPTSSVECYVYAYGVRDNTDAARAKFSDLVSPSGEDIARIVATRILTDGDITLTETKAVKVAVS